MLLVESDLFLDHFPFIGSESGDVKLISEKSETRDIETRFKLGMPQCLHIRDIADMGAHDRLGIAKRRSILDLDPLVTVGIVGSPDLRHIIEHPQIKAVPTAGKLEQNLWKSCCQIPLIDISQDNSGDKDRPDEGIKIGENIREIMIHIPLAVSDVCTLKNPEHLKRYS